MAKFFKYPFGTSGTRTSVSDTTDPNGYVSYQEGYGGDYSRPYGTDPLAKPIERTKLNDVLFEITNAIKQYQTNGVPDFITTADNGGAPYSYGIYAIVKYDAGSGFHNYMSLKDSNTSLPTVTADWRINPFSTDVASLIHAATSKTTPVDADELGICDSATSFSLKKLTFANLKAWIFSILETNNQSFSAYASSVQTLTSGVATKIAFGSKEFDYANKFDNVTNYRFQPSVAGLYLIECAVRVTSTAAITQASAALYKNGALAKEGDFQTSSTATISRPRVSALIELNGTTDYIEAYPAFTSSGTISVTAFSYSTYLQATLVRNL